MIRVKICGITKSKDALKAVSLGAWAIGFVFYKKSPRFIGPYKARQIIASLPPFVTPVGVFVNQKEGAVKEIAEFCRLNTLQLHGDESPVYCQRLRKYKIIKSFRVGEGFNQADLKNFAADAFLFDTFQKDAFGGSGKTFDWSKIKKIDTRGRPVILSGGLNANNVQKAIETVHPFAVDVASGVEQAPGKKSERLLKEFFGSLVPFD